MNIGDLTDIIVKDWPFDVTNYPRLARIPTEQHREFAIRHILMHQQKACGKLAEVSEPMEHGVVALLDETKLRLATRNFLINTLRLAVVVGITPDQLVRQVQSWAAEKHVS